MKKYRVCFHNRRNQKKTYHGGWNRDEGLIHAWVSYGNKKYGQFTRHWIDRNIFCFPGIISLATVWGICYIVAFGVLATL